VDNCSDSSAENAVGLGIDLRHKIQVQMEFFHMVCFSRAATHSADRLIFINEFVDFMYLNRDQLFDEKVSAIAEDILANSLHYHNGLLQDPNIWLSDQCDFDPLGLEEGLDLQIEEYVS
jgi:hypothetical protein